MAIFISFGLLKNFRKKEVVREGHEASTRVEGAPTLTGHAPCLVDTSCALRTPFSYTILLLVGKNSLYILPKVLTTVSRKYPLFSFRVVSVSDLRASYRLQALPRTSFSRGLSTPISRRCCNTHKSLRCVRGCCTSAMWRDQGVQEAWRQSSKPWSSKFSSAKGWWSVDSTPAR